jgi:hypothetical protein
MDLAIAPNVVNASEKELFKDEPPVPRTEREGH